MTILVEPLFERINRARFHQEVIHSCFQCHCSLLFDCVCCQCDDWCCHSHWTQLCARCNTVCGRIRSINLSYLTSTYPSQASPSPTRSRHTWVEGWLWTFEPRLVRSRQDLLGIQSSLAALCNAILLVLYLEIDYYVLYNRLIDRVVID
jgi:hypothetical protein